MGGLNHKRPQTIKGQLWGQVGSLQTDDDGKHTFTADQLMTSIFFFQPQVLFLSEIIFRYTHLQTEYKYVEQALHENIHHEVFGINILYPMYPHAVTSCI